MKNLSKNGFFFPLVVAAVWTVCIEFCLYAFFPSLFISYGGNWGGNGDIWLGSGGTSDVNQGFNDIMMHPVLYPTFHWGFIILSSLLIFSLIFVLLVFLKKKFPQTTLLFIAAIQSLLLVAVPILLFEPNFFSFRMNCDRDFSRSNELVMYTSEPFCIWDLQQFLMHSCRMALVIMGVPLMTFIVLKMRLKKDLSTLQRIAKLFTFLAVVLPLIYFGGIDIRAQLQDIRLRCYLEDVDPKDQYGKLREVCPSLGYKLEFLFTKWTLSPLEHQQKYPYRR
jgi:hypothetical protein